MEVDQWKPPSRSIVRSLMDGGEGPPLLREGCTVMRGNDWIDGNNEDGQDLYEQDKLDKEVKGEQQRKLRRKRKV